MAEEQENTGRRNFGSPQSLVQQRHESGRYAIAYFETATSLSVEFTPLCDAATEYLGEISANPYFLLDEMGSRVLQTVSPFAWIEAIKLKGADVQRRFATSKATITQEVIDGLTPDEHFTGLRVSLHFLGADTLHDPVVHSQFDVLSVILRSQIAGICHQLSQETRAVTLSEREQIVIKWAAMGKTSEDIAIILGVDKRQINYAFATAAAKLGTNSRLHTVIAAFKDNLIG